MYKEIFRWVIAIISQPAKAWVLLAKKGEKQEEFLSRFCLLYTSDAADD